MASNEASPHAAMTTERQSRLTRKQGYRETCSDWFSPGHSIAFSNLWQAHHVACDHALGGREIDPKDREYVEQCLWITKWDLNDADNLVGMPLNKQFRENYDAVPAPVNIPSHQVDHNTKEGYTEECKDWLKDNVWDTLKAGKDPHKVDAKDIAALLKKCTAKFKAKLKARGKRSGGTVLAWKGRFDPKNEDTWYKPFSMAAVPNPRGPGAQDSTMKGLFKKIPVK